MAGLVNPADLLTKFSLSKERILELVRLLGCYFGDGRPAQAPALREGQGSRLTMAEAERSGLTGAITESELGMPIMPHTALSQEQLDLLYPAVTAPDEIDDPDLSRDEHDLTFTNGMDIAQGIARDMVAYGRTRREGDRRRCVTLSKDGEGQSQITSGLLNIALAKSSVWLPAESPAAPKLRTADAALDFTAEAPPSGAVGCAALCGRAAPCGCAALCRL